MRAGSALAEYRGGGRLYSHYLNLRVLALEEFAGAAEGAAGTYASYEEVNLALGVLPDFRAGSCLVSGRVGLIGELGRDIGMRDGSGKLLCLGNGALHALGTVGQDDFCPVCLQKVAALHGHGLRHGEDSPVATGCRHAGQADAGVAAGRLDDDGILGELALGLSLLNHGLGDTVLDAACRVEIFQLYQDISLQAVGLDKVIGTEQRSAPDEFCYAIIYL